MFKIIAAIKAIAIIGKDGKVSREEIPALLNALADLCEGATDFTGNGVDAILKGVADALRAGASIIGQA